jgi:hypothetical protein
MKTQDLVTMLASGEGTVKQMSLMRPFSIAIGIGIATAIPIMLGMLGVRHDLPEAIRLPMYWAKVGYIASLAVISLLAVLRLSRPGRNLGRIPAFLAIPVAGMWALGAYTLINAEPMERVGQFLGKTWAVCPFLIVMLSIPTFIALFRVMKGLGPTRLRMAGAAVGMLSSAIGALVYCLHCPEMGAPFIGTWYLLGMLLPAAIGAWVGPRFLRW